MGTKKFERLLCRSFLVFALLGVLSGCSIEKEMSSSVDILSYLTNENDDYCASVLSIDVLNETIRLSQGELFSVSKTTGWQDAVYPIGISQEKLILFAKPTETSHTSCNIAVSNQLYFKDYSLLFDPDTNSAEIKKNDEVLGTASLMLDDTALLPEAFFIDEDGVVAVLCNTDGCGDFEKVYPVSVLYKKSTNKEKYEMTEAHTYNKLFEDDTLSKINIPEFTLFGTNIYSNGYLKAFLWNEGENIVEIDPYNGTARTIITEAQIKQDIPEIDTHREQYEFFDGAGYQEGIYMVEIPNYNHTDGAMVVFYDENIQFMGYILCTREAIILYDRDCGEAAKISNNNLEAMLFVPQENIRQSQ